MSQSPCASDPAVVAYLRRGEGRVLLVIVNLAGRPLRGVGVSSADVVLAPGAYRPRSLLGDAPARLGVGASGRLERYVPLDSLAPLSSQVIDLGAP